MLCTERMLFKPRRARSGMATVLGMLIFIGVIFTCVIPLFLYVNEVNSIYDSALTSMRRSDQDREREQIYVYGYPLTPPNHDILNVYIKNKCALPVKIVRVWVNDKNFTRTFEIPAMSECTMESLNISDLLPSETIFRMKVTTSRGNIYSSLTNPLYYSQEGGWYGGMGLTIQIVIETDKHCTRFYHINVTQYPSGGWSHQTDVVKSPHESSCFVAVTVPHEAEYHIEVDDGHNPLTPIPEYVNVDFAVPSQWVYVYDT